MAPSNILRDQNRELSVVSPEALRFHQEDLSSERERTLAAAWDAGYADGLQRAQLNAEGEAEQARTTLGLAQLALTEATTRAAAAFALERHTLECAAVELAFALTESILARELELVRSPGEEAIVRAIGEAPPNGEMVVRLNPGDVETIGDQVRPDGSPRIVADPAVGPGGCILEVGTTVVDARIETALERVRQAFDEVTTDSE
jgi:flagellar assembly protein FliH